MGKKKSSVSKFSALLDSSELDKLDELYNKPAKTSITKSSSDQSAESSDSVEESQKKEEEQVQEVIKEEDFKLVEPKTNPSSKRKTDEKKDYAVGYRITNKNDLAILILLNSGEFPATNKTEMLDYIISKFTEGKKNKEILEQGIKW